MAQIKFKGKVQSAYRMDDSIAYQYVRVPALDRKHCDMVAMRHHPKYANCAHSDRFRGMLNVIRETIFGGEMLRLDRIPDGVTVDTSGFLAVVSFEV